MEDKKDKKFQEIINNLFVSANTIKSIMHNILKNNSEIKQNHAGVHVLKLLDKNDTLTMTEICDHICISKPNLTPIIDQLIEKELVIRLYDEKDRRIIKIQLTKKGKLMIDKIKQIVVLETKKILNQLNNKDLEEFSNSLISINTILSKVNTNKEVCC